MSKRFYGFNVSYKETPHNWSHKHDFPIDEIWNTDNALAQLIVPRLQAFKALDNMVILKILVICVHGTIPFKR